jgi:hypothetical protein
MVVYYKYGVHLSEGVKKKIANACKKGISISIKLSKKNLHGNDMLALTQTQINKIKNAKHGVQLNLSASQLKYMIKNGGFLQLIPLIAGILGGVGGLTSGITSMVSAVKSNAEQKRHNEAIEQQLKSGTGVVSNVVGKIPVIGNILEPLLQKIGLGTKDINKIIKGGCLCKDGFLCKQIGSGLYLEPEGSGLFLGPRRE